MSDSKKNKVITVRLSESAYNAADARRSANGHKFQSLLESFLAQYSAGTTPTPYAIPPVGDSREPDDLVTSMTYIEQRNPTAAAALRELIGSLSREVTNATHFNAGEANRQPARPSTVDAAISAHGAAIASARRAMPGAGAGGADATRPGSKAAGANPVAKKGAR